MDVTKNLGIKCTNNSKTKNKILKFSKSSYINNNTNRIGFPLTNKNIICLKRTNKYKNSGIMIFTKLNLIDMDNKEQIRKIGKENFPEVIIDYSKNPYGKMIINLNFNETLSKERKKIEKNSRPYSNNIMILFFDSISRSTSIRQLKKTLKFFENFIHYKGNFNIKYPLENYHSFQFFKYHAFKGNTFGNYKKLFYWKKSRITKYLKQKGYVTAFSNDICARDSCYIPYDISNDEICDHELILCDPNMKSINSMFKRCLYDKINCDYQYEYGFQFWTKYRKNRKFLLIINNDGHEGTLEVIKYDDDIIFNFLNSLYNKNLLKDTTIILLSDHGCPMPSIYYYSQFFYIDKFLPMCYFFIYDKKNVSYDNQYKYIYKNQQNLITAYDIYNTIVYLIFGEDYLKEKIINSFGKNLFSKISKKRTPFNYSNMPYYICT